MTYKIVSAGFMRDIPYGQEKCFEEFEKLCAQAFKDGLSAIGSPFVIGLYVHQAFAKHEVGLLSQLSYQASNKILHRAIARENLGSDEDDSQFIVEHQPGDPAPQLNQAIANEADKALQGLPSKFEVVDFPMEPRGLEPTKKRKRGKR